MLLSRKTWLRAMAGSLGTIFFKGLIAVLPISLTLAVFIWIAGIFEGIFSRPLILVVGSYYRTGMGLVTGFFLIFLVGLIVNLWFTQQVLAWGERLLQNLPLAKTILHGVKDLMGFFHRDSSQAPNQVVVVEINGMKLLGLVTRQSLADMPTQISEGDRVAVFFPMSYQMGGFTMFVPRTVITPVGMPMEDAMRFILTAGVKTHPKNEDASQDAPASPAPLPADANAPAEGSSASHSQFTPPG